MKISSPEYILPHLLPDTSTIKDALDAINTLSGSIPLLFVIDKDEKLIGTLTDGDIRRALLRGVELSSSVCVAMNVNFTSIEKGENPYPIVADGKRRNLKLIPVTENGHIRSLIDLDSLKAMLPLDVVMMAGGRGERLRPLTLTTPKPLLPVAGVPIIDRNIEILESYGIRKIYVTVNYLHEAIEEHFVKREAVSAKEGRVAKVECVLEPKRLGTMGSLALVPEFQHDNILVMNSDLLTNLDFEKMWKHHLSTDAVLTIGAVPYTVSVPYAIMKTSGSEVLGLEEKPTFNYFANGGVYILKRELLNRIIKNEYLDAPDFIETLISEGLKVGYFPIEGRWIDIGSPDDYRAANALLSQELKN